MRTTPAPRRQAVVLGGSIAGLLAARVLAETYERVVVLDRDGLDGAEDRDGHRRGAPQGRHLHGLMERGRQIMEGLHSGLTAELSAAGAPTTEVLQGSRWYLCGLRVHPTSTGLTTVLASRPMLERTLRARTAALPNVELRQRCAVVGLAGSGRAVTGVRTVGGTVPADLVVDATGRGSRTPEWLSELGHRAPPEERVDVDLGYSSRIYRRRPEHLDGALAVVVSTMPGFNGGGAVALEGDRWHVTLAGMLGEHPPTDGPGFERFAATLPVPDVHDVVRTAEPLTDPVPHRFRGSLRRRYEDLSRPPAGLLVVGDALCSFNPLYAQGMTVAAQEALVLAECLTERELDPHEYYRRAGQVVDVAWRMSTGSDLRYPGVQGRRTLPGRVLGAYVRRAQVAAHHHPAVARTFMRTANLTEPPAALLAPAVVGLVLRHGGRP